MKYLKVRKDGICKKEYEFIKDRGVCHEIDGEVYCAITNSDYDKYVIRRCVVELSEEQYLTILAGVD